MVSRDGHELGAILPVGVVLVQQGEVGFVDEGGGLEGVAGTFVAEEVGGKAAEFLVDEGHESGEYILVAGFDFLEQDGAFACWTMHGASRGFPIVIRRGEDWGRRIGEWTGGRFSNWDSSTSRKRGMRRSGGRSGAFRRGKWRLIHRLRRRRDIRCITGKWRGYCG